MAGAFAGEQMAAKGGGHGLCVAVGRGAVVGLRHKKQLGQARVGLGRVHNIGACMRPIRAGFQQFFIAFGSVVVKARSIIDLAQALQFLLARQLQGGIGAADHGERILFVLAHRALVFQAVVAAGAAFLQIAQGLGQIRPAFLPQYFGAHQPD